MLATENGLRFSSVIYYRNSSCYGFEDMSYTHMWLRAISNRSGVIWEWLEMGISGYSPGQITDEVDWFEERVSDVVSTGIGDVVVSNVCTLDGDLLPGMSKRDVVGNHKWAVRQNINIQVIYNKGIRQDGFLQ
ncbi:Hypothetical predicted protein [Paramuricea clavata]|uniref:Uncharacterized protein n=1 Tax=Paramuricea clavata TaxID=317549 RepID=A0A7D9IFX6_PARCT|nr:Hypothetical predicted protein [Paramuricea clavata]